MKLQDHSTEEIKLPDLEVKVSTIDILRRLLKEVQATITAEMGYRKSRLENTRDLVLAYEKIELASFYVLRSLDDYSFDVMKQMVEDVEATKELLGRTNGNNS